MAAEHRAKHSQDALGIQVLAKLRAKQSECFVQTPIGIAEPRHIQHSVWFEEPLRFCFRAQMHKRQGSAFCFDRLALLGQVCYRFATEGAAEVAQENQKKGTPGKSGEGLAGL